MTLANYLAQNYLSADKPLSSKKRKRKNDDENGLIIADDDDDGRKSSSRSHKPRHHDQDPSSRSKKIGSAWKTVGTLAPTNAEQAAADEIVAAAAAEKSREQEALLADDAPVIVKDDGIEPTYDGPMMASGAGAGLQSAAQITAALERRAKQERDAMIEAGMGVEDGQGLAQETIYRDASGRILNAAMKRAELRKKEEQKAKLEEDNRIAARGDVQNREREKRRDELEKAKEIGVARYADDADMNNEMKDTVRWNDPAARFLTEVKIKANNGSRESWRKAYQGASEPNRYGIKPGYRWDGVDRSNGFERKWFAARNNKQSIKEQEYAWEMDE